MEAMDPRELGVRRGRLGRAEGVSPGVVGPPTNKLELPGEEKALFA